MGTRADDAPGRTAVDDGRAWDVTVADRGTGQETTYRYAGLVVGNGHNWNPKIPDYAGRAEFRGEVIHSADYKGPEVLRGKRVLVVGAGNTGCDVAVEAAQNATHAWHSTRRGYYYNPKYMTGRPSDQVADSLLALRLPLGLRRVLFKSSLAIAVGDLTKFGLKRPDHKFFETHPIVNQQLVYYVGQGDITPKDDIDHFDADGVVFTDGSRIDVDLSSSAPATSCASRSSSRTGSTGRTTIRTCSCRCSRRSTTTSSSAA